MYWIGKGVLGCGENSVKFGEKIPDSVPKATLDSLIEKGKAAETMPAATEIHVPSKDEARIKKLEAQVKELEGELREKHVRPSKSAGPRS